MLQLKKIMFFKFKIRYINWKYYFSSNLMFKMIVILKHDNIFAQNLKFKPQWHNLILI